MQKLSTMNDAIREPGSKLSLVKILLFSVACIAIFIAVALICGSLTSWIPSNALRIAVQGGCSESSADHHRAPFLCNQSHS